MDRIYLDNAATSFPKAPGAADSMFRFLSENGCNINRSSYETAALAEDVVLDTRHLLCRLFHFSLPSHVVFTPGITFSLNTILRGLLRPGDHCIVSGFEHNAVMRPLASMGVSFSIAKLDPDGHFDKPEALFRPNTRLVVITHASNVFGNILPVSEIAPLCRKKGIPLVLDCAQTAGHIPIDWKELDADALCFSGHKGLLGPQGTGGMLLSPFLAKELPPLIEGGTGSVSDSLETPGFMPDKFEAGTPNIPGLWGLHASVEFLLQTGVDSIAAYEASLTQELMEGLAKIPGVSVLKAPGVGQVGVVSVVFHRLDLAQAAWELEQQFGIQTRCGLHCAPLAHQTMGTAPAGTVRFSVGYATTRKEIEAALLAVRAIA